MNYTLSVESVTYLVRRRTARPAKVQKCAGSDEGHGIFAGKVVLVLDASLVWRFLAIPSDPHLRGHVQLILK